MRVSRPFSDAALPAILVSNLFKIKVENIISMKRNICTPPAHNTTNQVVPLCLGCFGAGESPLEICHCVSDGKWHDGRSRSGRQSLILVTDIARHQEFLTAFKVINSPAHTPPFLLFKQVLCHLISFLFQRL